YTAHRHSALAVPDVQNLSQDSCQRRRRSADAYCTKRSFWTLPKCKDSLGRNAPAIDRQPTNANQNCADGGACSSVRSSGQSAPNEGEVSIAKIESPSP